MKNLLKTEELCMFFLAVLAFKNLEFPWWIFPVFLLLPDASIFGYLVNNTFGAALYNFFHHKGIAIIAYFTGIYIQNEILQLCGIILFAHACMDRIFGYGLKYISSFQDTHLGKSGKTKKLQFNNIIFLQG